MSHKHAITREKVGEIGEALRGFGWAVGYSSTVAGPVVLASSVTAYNCRGDKITAAQCDYSPHVSLFPASKKRGIELAGKERDYSLADAIRAIQDIVYREDEA
jgi:hypothetical protein